MSGLNFHAIRLFKIMHRRAQDGLRGLTVAAYCNALDVDDRSIILDSLNRLEKAGVIRVDVGGERPGIMILKGHHKAGKPLDQPLCLPRDHEPNPGAEPKPKPSGRAGKDEPVSSVARNAYIDRLEDLDRKAKAVVASSLPDAFDDSNVADGVITFAVTREEMDEITELLDHEPEPITLPRFAKRIFMSQLDHIRAEGMAKHRLTAAVLRAAREDGRSLEEFVTGLIDAGFMAYQAGRAEG